MALTVDTVASIGKPAGTVAQVDAGLLLNGLEAHILKGEKVEQVQALLQKERLWQRLNPADRLRWTELAQMAQMPAVACRLLAEMNLSHPDCAEAWEKHLELLHLMGPAERFAGLLAKARPYIGEARHDHWLHSGGSHGIAEDTDLHKTLRDQATPGPARQLIRREAAHLVRRLKELSGPLGMVPLVEFSGAKGYHFWYFFNAPTPAGPVRSALHNLARQLQPDLTAFGLEVFPKQDQPGGKGFGNLVKPPDYTPHLVDYRLSRLRGTPLGCRRIHALLSYTGRVCRFARPGDYLHPLLHIEGWQASAAAPAEKADNLTTALERLQTAMAQVERFLK